MIDVISRVFLRNPPHYFSTHSCSEGHSTSGGYNANVTAYAAKTTLNISFCRSVDTIRWLCEPCGRAVAAQLRPHGHPTSAGIKQNAQKLMHKLTIIANSSYPIVSLLHDQVPCAPYYVSSAISTECQPSNNTPVPIPPCCTYQIIYI